MFRASTCLGDAEDAGVLAAPASTRDAGDAGDAGDAWASSFVRGACVEVLLWTDSSCFLACPRILFSGEQWLQKDG